MTEELATVRGSGNVFADLGLADVDVEQTKALLAAEIIRILDEEELSVRATGPRTGIAYTEFSRIRNIDLDRFTIDRLMKILGRFGRRVDVPTFRQSAHTRTGIDWSECRRARDAVAT